jgi:hypothetical protein
MAASERAALVGVAAALALAIAGCDVLLGLTQYSDVACAFPDSSSCVDAAEGGMFVPDTGPGPEVGPPDTGSDVDAGGLDAADDADADADADAGDVVVPEAGWPVPTGHESWAHWFMPNPDAAIAPDSATLLPHTMTYDAGADGGGATVFDLVTKLRWTRSFPAATLDAAWSECAQQPVGPWRVPSRIELLSLVDFTQPNGHPTADPGAFPDTASASYWTSSPVPGDGGAAGSWSISFATGLAATTGGASYVRCVQGGVP